MAANQQKQNRRVITSFMLRFVQEVPAENDESGSLPASDITATSGTAWRGVVKHIQSGAEQHFSTLDEAEIFIKKYIE